MQLHSLQRTHLWHSSLGTLYHLMANVSISEHTLMSQWACTSVVNMGVIMACYHSAEEGWKKREGAVNFGWGCAFNTQLRIVREQWEKSSKRKRLRAGKENICKWWCSSLSQMTFIHAVITCAVMEAAMTDQTPQLLNFWACSSESLNDEIGQVKSFYAIKKFRERRYTCELHVWCLLHKKKTCQWQLSSKTSFDSYETISDGVRGGPGEF